MVDVNITLEAMRAALESVTGVKTCKIGIEPNMTPDDYPIIRLVPSRLYPLEVSGRRRVEVMVYYGAPMHSFDGMAALYGELLRLEAAIIGVIEAGAWVGLHKDTITDEDRLQTYKLFMSRFEVMG